MTPAARISAAIEVLDRWLAGAPVEQVLTNWGRANRYAGSGDRRAIRDLVYDAVRRKRSYAWVGGAETGRALMLGALRVAGEDPAGLFTGDAHAPAPVGDEAGQALDHAPPAVRLDCPDWIFDAFGDAREPLLAAMQSRAPVFLRVNSRKASVSDAIAALQADGIGAQPHPLADHALEVIAGAPALARSAAYCSGLVELQDVSSQAVVEALPVQDGLRVLDYCAGGGGKSLALAALGAKVTAHDANPGRMRDIMPRATRAGVSVKVLDHARSGTWPLVVVDAPCSGTGTWRRDPEAKWRLTHDWLESIRKLQAQIFNQAARFVADGGQIAWITCSLLDRENAGQVDRFLSENNGFDLVFARQFTPLEGGDGFGVSLVRRK